MKSKIFVFIALILVGILFGITSCQDINNSNSATVTFNLDLSKILKTSRNETSQNSEYILKLFAYNAAGYKSGEEIENLVLLAQTENKVGINGQVKASLDIEIGLYVIFVGKLYEVGAENPIYSGNSEVVKIKATDNKVNLVLKRANTDLEIDVEIEDHEHTFADSWTSDETYHWHAATCEHTTEVGGKAKHTFGDWKVTKESTEEEEGSKERTCTVCGYTATEVIAKLDHTHTFADSWTSDETYHWHAATCEHTTEVSDKAEHDFTNGICECGMREMVLIPAGTFQMGSNAGDDDEKPVHEVTITKDFYMGKYEVTQEEYEKYCSYGGSIPDSTYGDGNNYPVYYVSWYDALVYCNKRSIAEGLTPCYSINENTDPTEWGLVPTSSNSTWDAVVCNWDANGYRLPTEAEWEYAARAGDKTVSSLTYAGTNIESELGEYAWYNGNSDEKAHEVGTRLSNSFGLYDMSGNVMEWCWNWYTSSYNTETVVCIDPTGTSSGDCRVYRGGSWFNN